MLREVYSSRPVYGCVASHGDYDQVLNAQNSTQIQRYIEVLLLPSFGGLLQIKGYVIWV